MGIVDFNNVTFTYDAQRNALDGVTLRIEPGSFTCVLGGNGSGKSTLAKHMNALLVPDGGSVTTLGMSTADVENRYAIRSNVGMVFQNPDDQIVASVVEDDVAFGPENLGVPTDELQRRVSAALTQVGLQGFEKKETAALSGGQKQRVAIAGVLAMEPQVLVFDESSAMLDPRGRAGLARVCRELNAEGLTIVLITHFMEEAAHADRVIVMDAGHVVLDGPPEEVLARMERLQELSLDVPFAAKMSRELANRDVEGAPQVELDALADALLPLVAPAGKRAVQPVPLVPLAPSVEERAGATAGDTRAAGSDANAGADAGTVEVAQADGAGAVGAVAADAVAVGAVADGAGLAGTGVEIDSSPARESSGQAVLSFEGVSFTYQPMPKGRKRRKHGRNLVATDAEPADWGNDPTEYWALRDVSFAIERGEFLGIAGHTGSGKSTLIQLANGLLQPTVGRVVANGRDLADKRAAVETRRDVGVVFQYPENQLFAASVFDDVAFGPRNLGLSAAEVEERVRAALELVHLDLDELRDTSPFALSGGQQRRVAFAGVLAMQPTTLILDEPIAGLDPRARRSFLNLISELHRDQGMTVAIVSHDMNDLARLCDRILVLNQGRLFAIGSPASVFADSQRMKSIGLGVPDTLKLARRLGMDLIDFGGNVPGVEELADQIALRVRTDEDDNVEATPKPIGGR